MYEQDEPVLRRMLLMGLWFIVVVTIAWAIVWLVFFRHNHSTAPAGHANTHLQSSSGSKPQPSDSGGSRGGGTSSAGPSQSVTGVNPAGSTSDGLTNVGAGNVFVPFTLASLAGTAYYYVRLRKKVAR